MRTTVDILEEFNTNLDLSGEVYCHEVIGNTTLIRGTNIFNLREGMNVFIDGITYKVLDSEPYVDRFTVDGIVNNPKEFIVPTPFFFHGTPLMTNSELSKLEQRKKLPMVYVLEVIRDRLKDVFSSIYKEPEIRIFFLDQINKRDWQTDDHYEKRIRGLDKLADYYFKEMQAERRLFYLREQEAEKYLRVNWGRYQDEKGNTASLFNERLSGVELKFTLPIKRDCILGIKRPLCSGDIKAPSVNIETISGKLLYYGEYITNP